VSRGAGRAGVRRWLLDLGLGVRMSVAGGREGWLRLLLVGVGVSVGVAMLLVTAALPTLVAERSDRADARSFTASEPVAAPHPGVYVRTVASQVGEQSFTVVLVQPDADDPARTPTPPGVQRLPRAGELVVSPELARLLSTVPDDELADRWPGTVIGTIDAAGLTGPRELFAYVGSDALAQDGTAVRIGQFGAPGDAGGMPPVFVLLAVVGIAALLLPVMVFLAAAVRVGGQARDRRLAAVRLVGADAAMIRRIAAGETLVGTLLGLALGGAAFAGAVALGAATVPPGLSFAVADARPVPVLAALVVLAVPLTAIGVATSAMREVVVQPLGVVRRAADRRRRWWWRLAFPAVGVALLVPLRGALAEGANPGSFVVYQALLGVVALLVGVALLLPWAVEAVVRRLGAGPVPWELSVRWLQSDAGGATRAVTGIAVSAAGLLAVGGLLAGVQAQLDDGPAGGFDARVLPGASDAALGADWPAHLSAVDGVTSVATLTATSARPAAPGVRGDDLTVTVGTCAALAQAIVVDDCADGDAFVVSGGAAPAPGTELLVGDPGGAPEDTVRATVPAGVREAAAADVMLAPTGLFLTPGVLDGPVPAIDPMQGWTEVYAAVDRDSSGVIDRLRTAVSQVDPTADVRDIRVTNVDRTLGTVRQLMLVGTVALLAVVAASLVVGVLDQQRERRRIWAVLAAFGTPRRVLGAAVMWQVAIPVALGVGLALVTGTVLAASLQSLVGAPLGLNWSDLAVIAASATGAVALATAATLPGLRRSTGPHGLRAE